MPVGRGAAGSHAQVTARAGPGLRASAERPQPIRPVPLDVVLGRGCLIDDSVILAARPGRPLRSTTLHIGRRAIVRSGSVLYAGSRIGDGLETGHNVVIREDNVIGSDFKVWNNAIVDYGCTIGDRVKIHSNCYVAQLTTIEDDVFLSPGVTLANDPHPGSANHLCMRGPTIKRGARIGVNATILPFITIGERAFVGAGAVVTHDVPPGMVVVGNPARILKSVGEVTCPLDLEAGEYLAAVAPLVRIP